jgi:hypothetical protein
MSWAQSMPPLFRKSSARHSPGAGISIDDSHFPLLHVVMLEPTHEEWLWLLAGYDEILGRRQRFVQVVDAMRQTRAASATTRAAITDFLKQRLELMKQYNIGTSCAVSSGLIRGALNAVLWFVPPPVPWHTSASTVASLDWAVNKLDEEGAPVPQAVRHRQLELL